MRSVHFVQLCLDQSQVLFHRFSGFLVRPRFQSNSVFGLPLALRPDKLSACSGFSHGSYRYCVRPQIFSNRRVWLATFTERLGGFRQPCLGEKWEMPPSSLARTPNCKDRDQLRTVQMCFGCSSYCSLPKSAASDLTLVCLSVSLVPGACVVWHVGRK